MRRPEVRMSGTLICGGEMVTFSPGFSTAMSSSKVMVTFFACVPVRPRGGFMSTMRGGVSS